MMVKVLLYAYATGVFSSAGWRGGWKRTWRSGCWRRETFPHRTLCEFRRRHLEDFQARSEVVRLAQELGLARLGKLSIDGVRTRAMSYDHAGRGTAPGKRIERRKADADEAEDTRLGAEVRTCRRMHGKRFGSVGRRRRVWSAAGSGPDPKGVGVQASGRTRRLATDPESDHGRAVRGSSSATTRRPWTRSTATPNATPGELPVLDAVKDVRRAADVLHERDRPALRWRRAGRASRRLPAICPSGDVA